MPCVLGAPCARGSEEARGDASGVGREPVAESGLRNELRTLEERSINGHRDAGKVMENGCPAWQTACHHSWTTPSKASGRSSTWPQRT
eukprot:5294208-Lingulodinium_polyedra.AAC.1